MNALVALLDEPCTVERCGKLQSEGLCNRHYQKAWRKANAEHVKEAKRRWYEQNRQITIERARARAQADPERDRTYKTRYRQSDPDRARAQQRAHEARRRAHKKAAAINDFTAEQWEELLVEHDHQCVYCGSGDDLQQDHKVPLSRGGDHTKANIAPACGSCNRRKGAMTSEEYIIRIMGQKIIAHRAA